MAYCGPKGIPHSVFLGRAPAPGEPAWLPEDMVKALEWQAWEAARCSGCGVHPHDWQDATGRELPDIPFEAEPVYCAVCHIREDAQADLPSDPEEKRGRTIGLRRAAIL